MSDTNMADRISDSGEVPGDLRGLKSAFENVKARNRELRAVNKELTEYLRMQVAEVRAKLAEIDK
jgi:hypothetical protein